MADTLDGYHRVEPGQRPWAQWRAALTPVGHATGLAFLRHTATGPRRNLG